MTMTSTEQATLDWLDFASTCSVPGCDHAADWWVICRACNAHETWCECCRRREVAAADALGIFGRVKCAQCQEKVRGRFWRRLFVVVPIGNA